MDAVTDVAVAVTVTVDNKVNDEGNEGAISNSTTTAAVASHVGVSVDVDTVAVAVATTSRFIILERDQELINRSRLIFEQNVLLLSVGQ